MARKSAGLLMFRRRNSAVELLLVHPGGPFWAKKDLGAWSIPKGEYEEPDDPLEAAQREFREETGFLPREPFLALGSLKQPSGKLITAWAFEGDCDPKALESNRFELEWPPKSGRIQSFPEVDRAEWFDSAEARRRILPGQSPFVDAVEKVALGESSAITRPI
jgi:predicted NUDIX family NTP pyrophosphohydrolase